VKESRPGSFLRFVLQPRGERLPKRNRGFGVSTSILPGGGYEKRRREYPVRAAMEGRGAFSRGLDSVFIEERNRYRV